MICYVRPILRSDPRMLRWHLHNRALCWDSCRNPSPYILDGRPAPSDMANQCVSTRARSRLCNSSSKVFLKDSHLRRQNDLPWRRRQHKFRSTPCNADAVLRARTLLPSINALLHGHLLLSHDDRSSWIDIRSRNTPWKQQLQCQSQGTFLWIGWIAWMDQYNAIVPYEADQSASRRD